MTFCIGTAIFPSSTHFHASPNLLSPVIFSSSLATPMYVSKSSRTSKKYGIGVSTDAWKNGFVHAPYMSGCFRSIHDGTPKIMSAYSHVAVQNQSLTIIISILGIVLIITSYAHLLFPNMELPFTHQAVLVGVEMWLDPVNSLF